MKKAILIGLFLGVSFLILILIFIGQVNKEEFKITKQECWEKMYLKDYTYPDDYKRIDCPENFNTTYCYLSKDNNVLTVFEGGFMLNFPTNDWFDEFNATIRDYPVYEEICEDVVVDDFNWTSCNDKYNSPINWYIGERTDLIENESMFCYATYNKLLDIDDLDIDWLENNCEPVNDSFYQENCRKTNRFPKTYCEGKFSKYKCGEYTVEVLV